MSKWLCGRSCQEEAEVEAAWMVGTEALAKACYQYPDQAASLMRNCSVTFVTQLLG